MRKSVLLALFLSFLLICAMFLPASAAEPERGGTFRWGMIINPRGMFNPILSTETYDSNVHSRIFDALIAIGPDLMPEPRIAERWEFSDDGLSLTFYIREGVKFHDGVELTAEDVAYTFQTICHPDYTGIRFSNFRVIKGAEEFKRGEADAVEGIEVIDDYTIRFTLSEPNAPFLVRFNMGILPKHLLEDIPVAELEFADFNQNPIGAGPFKFGEFRPNQHVVLERFDDYYRDGLPYLDRIIFYIISDEARPVWLRQGRIDFVEIPSEQFPIVSELDFVDVYYYDDLNYSYFCFNLRQEMFQDKRVRQAIVYATDRETIVDVILDGFPTIANAPMPSASWAYTTEGINEYPYNLDLAKELLAEAGWHPGRDGILEKDGVKFEFEFLVIEGTRTTEQIALLIQQCLADIGINVNLRFMEFSAAVDRVDAREFDTFMMSFNLSVDPDPYLLWHSSAFFNDAGFVNERSDELIEVGRQETDIEKRKEIYAEWQRLINEEVPNMFLTFRTTLQAINQRVMGIDRNPGPVGTIPDFAKIWIPKDRQ